MDEIRLAFGCGNLDYHSKGYENVDVRSFPHIDHIVDISKKLPWQDNSIDEILAESVLEHIPHGFCIENSSYSRAHLNTIEVLKEWRRVLKVGSKCIVKVPNVKGLISCYSRKKIPYRDFWMYMYGGQNFGTNIHYAGFDPFTLIEVMTLAGFRDVVIRNAHNLEQNLDEENAWEMTGIGVK